MTKYFKLLIVALFATLSFTLTSCGDDDEPNGSDGSIIGTWKVETMKADDDFWQVDYVRFEEDGSYISVAVMNIMGSIDTEEDSGTWSKKGNKITMDGQTATIKSLNSNKMILNLGGMDITYNRCSDSEMEQYL